MTRSTTEAGNTVIPWQEQQTWLEVTDSVRHILVRREGELAGLCTTAGELLRGIEALSAPIDSLCRQTCACCSDICCRRATVWYDSVDILILALAKRPLPRAQIRKVRDSRGRSACHHLGGQGCDLPRSERPFICTWYICPAQTHLLRDTDPGAVQQLLNDLSGLKKQRKSLEEAFIRITVI